MSNDAGETTERERPRLPADTAQGKTDQDILTGCTMDHIDPRGYLLCPGQASMNDFIWSGAGQRQVKKERNGDRDLTSSRRTPY